MGRGLSQPKRIVILGGGYVGLYTALGLQRKLKGNEASVTVIDPQPHMTYQPFLPEAAAVEIEAPDGHHETVEYDILVVALGSVARLMPIPGLAEQGISFKTIGEAIYLRNHVMSKLDAASTTRDAELRRKLLTFTFVGGGFAGIEALGELEDMARYATRYYENIEPSDLRWVLVEAAGRILPEVRESLGVYTVLQLEKRGIEVYLSTLAKSLDR